MLTIDADVIIYKNLAQVSSKFLQFLLRHVLALKLFKVRLLTQQLTVKCALQTMLTF